MINRFYYSILLIAVAAVFWVELFLLRNFNFWIEMMIATSLLATMSLFLNHRAGSEINFRLYFFESRYIILGIFSAAILYAIFFTGGQVVRSVLPFTAGQISEVYATKTEMDPLTIGFLLLFFIGPAEEVFWRGFIQDTMQLKFGDNAGWIITSVLYAAVHIVAMNPILVVAALVCGLFWGYIFKRYRSLWPGIISHALWDVVIFVMVPIT